MSSSPSAVSFSLSIIRANAKRLNEPGTLGLLVSAVAQVDRDVRKTQFPRKLIDQVVRGLESLEVTNINVRDMLLLTSHLCDDKAWKVAVVVSNLVDYFSKQELRNYSPSDQVHLVKCIANMSRVRVPSVEEVEKYMDVCIELLRCRSAQLTGAELSGLLWGFVTLRRSRNFSASNHYRKREANLLFTADLVACVRDCTLAKIDETSIFHLVQIAWSLASSGVWTFPAMNALAERLKREFDSVSMRNIGLFVWACAITGHRDDALLAMTKARFENHTSSNVDAIIPWSLGNFEISFDASKVKVSVFPEQQDFSRPATTSSIHTEIGHKFENQGWSVKHEVEVGPDLIVDLIIQRDGKKYAVEIDGPNHFITLCDGTRKTSGASEHKARLVEALGLKVINVDIMRYKQFKPGSDRSRFLRRIFDAESDETVKGGFAFKSMC